MHRDIFSLIEHQAVHEIVGTGIIHENAVLLVSDTMMNCNGKERERELRIHFVNMKIISQSCVYNTNNDNYGHSLAVNSIHISSNNGSRGC